MKYLLAGADVVMTTSSLLKYGPSHATKLVSGLEQWMLHKGFNSIDDFRGLLAVPTDVDGAAYERHGYVAALTKARSSYEEFAVATS